MCLLCRVLLDLRLVITVMHPTPDLYPYVVLCYDQAELIIHRSIAVALLQWEVPSAPMLAKLLVVEWNDTRLICRHL